MNRGDHLRLEIRDLGLDLIRIRDGLIIRQTDFAYLGAERRSHVPDAVAENASGNGQHPITGNKAAFQSTPQREHAFTGLNDDLVLSGHNGFQVGFGAVV